MPGRMGGHQVTTQNVKVMKVDEEKGIVVLNGPLPSPPITVGKTHGSHRLHTGSRRMRGQTL